ncbi:MAG: hypothetical protein ABFE07_28390 [Armatimonadia bacterium]
MTRVYLVLKNADMTEGRGPMLAHLLFLHEDHAERFIVEQGQDRDFYSIRPMELLDGSYFTERDRQEELRRRALTKLSVEERRALGLDEDGEHV